jgi:hypothetical protein
LKEVDVRRRFLIVSLFAACVVPLAAATIAAAGPGGDRIVGGGRDAFDANVSISAHSGPNGEDPRGHNNATLPLPDMPGVTFKVRLDVVCVAVVGNLAAVGAVVTESASNDLPPGTPFVVVFRDTGLPGGAGDAIEPFPGLPPAACADFVGLAAAAPPLRNGNVSILDA